MTLKILINTTNFQIKPEIRRTQLVYEDDGMFFGTEDTQPELFAPENREHVEFDKFEGFEKSVKKLRINFKILKTVTTLSLIQYFMV